MLRQGKEDIQFKQALKLMGIFAIIGLVLWSGVVAYALYECSCLIREFTQGHNHD